MSNRRKPVEENRVRELAYGVIEEIEIPEHKVLGRHRDGIVFENSDGYCIIVKTIAKGLDFDGEFEVTDYENQQAKKKLEAEKKRAEKEKKIARDKAERERKKAEQEAKKEELKKK